VEEGRARGEGSEIWGLRSAHGCGGSYKPALRPVRYRCQHRLERSPARRQSIAHPYRRSRVDEPLHDALRLQLAKAFRQDSIADAWNPAGMRALTTAPVQRLPISSIAR